MQIKQLLQQAMQSLTTSSDKAAQTSAHTPLAKVDQAQQHARQSLFNALTSQLSSSVPQPRSFGAAQVNAQLQLPAGTASTIQQQVEQLALRASGQNQPPLGAKAQHTAVMRLVERILQSDATLRLPSSTNPTQSPATTSSGATIALRDLPPALQKALTESLGQQLSQHVKVAANRQNSVSSTPLNPLSMTLTAVKIDQAQLILQLQSSARVVSDVRVPIAQMPPAILRSLLQQLTREPAQLAQPRSGLMPAAMAEPTAVDGRFVKQTQTMTPAQLTQFLQQSLAATSPQHGEVKNLLNQVLAQLPQAEQLTQPQQLTRYVNDWFAAKPVSPQPNHQFGVVGKLIVALLGLRLQTQQSGASSQAAKGLSQAVLDQIMRGPAERNPGSERRLDASTPMTAEVRERLNTQLLQQPMAQLQRLLSTLSQTMNAVQSSQMRLQDSPSQQPEFYLLLPSQNPLSEASTELLIKREPDEQNDEHTERSVWLFNLRFELKQWGPMLVKGRYQVGGTRVQFYTESLAAQQHLQQQLPELEQRLTTLEVASVDFQVKQGKVPDTLAQQHSGIIRVTV